MAGDIPRLVQGMDLLQEGFVSLPGRCRREAIRQTDPDRPVLCRRHQPGDRQGHRRSAQRQGIQSRETQPSFKPKWQQAEKDGKTVALAGSWISNGKYVD